MPLCDSKRWLFPLRRLIRFAPAAALRRISALGTKRLLLLLRRGCHSELHRRPSRNVRLSRDRGRLLRAHGRGENRLKSMEADEMKLNLSFRFAELTAEGRRKRSAPATFYRHLMPFSRSFDASPVPISKVIIEGGGRLNERITSDCRSSDG